MVRALARRAVRRDSRGSARAVIPARALALAGIVVGSTQVLAALARLVRPAALVLVLSLVLSPVAALGAGVGLPLLLQG
ncbi:MAG: hypothetical protein ABWZ91_02235, partial [Nocardioides sp.]